VKAREITPRGFSARSIALAALIATNPFDRARGIIGRSGFSTIDAFVLVGCSAIHTCFMGRPLDVLFLDDRGIVVRIVERVSPWRFGLICRAARSAVELPAGFVAAHRTTPASMPLFEVVPQTPTALWVPELA